MLHPSYTDLLAVVNTEEENEENASAENSRYSIVLATAKRARQLIDGATPKVESSSNKALSVAVEEFYEGKVKIVGKEEAEEPEEAEAVEEESAE